MIISESRDFHLLNIMMQPLNWETGQQKWGVNLTMEMVSLAKYSSETGFHLCKSVLFRIGHLLQCLLAICRLKSLTLGRLSAFG